jgi:hypothetical protein
LAGRSGAVGFDGEVGVAPQAEALEAGCGKSQVDKKIGRLFFFPSERK